MLSDSRATEKLNINPCFMINLFSVLHVLNGFLIVSTLFQLCTANYSIHILSLLWFSDVFQTHSLLTTPTSSSHHIPPYWCISPWAKCRWSGGGGGFVWVDLFPVSRTTCHLTSHLSYCSRFYLKAFPVQSEHTKISSHWRSSREGKGGDLYCLMVISHRQVCPGVTEM